MHFSGDLLNQSVEHAARVVALELLDAAAKARKRLDDPEDAEALHDFRVAVRRLRTWLRASDDFLGDSTPKKAKQRLKKTARLTGKARDAEVHREWLDAQRAHLGAHQRHGHTWLAKKIADDKAKSDREVTSEAAPEFDRAAATFTRKLRSYRVDVDDDDGDMPRSFAAEMAELIREQGNKLWQCLAEVQSFEDAKEGHQARIAGKRLRYLVEIVADAVSGGEELVTELGEMQDLLGDWHDADVFSDEITALDKEKSDGRGADVSAGLQALTTRLERRGRKAFASVKRRWLGKPTFQTRVEAIVDELSSRGGKGAEIERKYLLAKLPELPNDAAMVEIEQGYLPGGRVEERLRRVLMAGDEKRYFRTFKSGKGLARMELEEPVAKTLFNRMWPLTRGCRLHKRRYTVSEDGHAWEVDQFLDRDLVLAEVELDSPDESVDMPSWLASVVTRDVTGESEFSNASLASARKRARRRKSNR